MADVNEHHLKSYIDGCIRDACKACERENDVQYQYRICYGHLLFAIKSKYQKVRTRVEYRLLHNLPKNFGLDFHLVYPWGQQESYECWQASMFSLLEDGIDIYRSIGVWEVFGREYTIQSHRGFFAMPEKPYDYAYTLQQHGFNVHDITVPSNQLIEAWQAFETAFIAAYDKTPEEVAAERDRLLST